jgi:toxin HigB-1
VIKTFADNHTAGFYRTGRSRRIPPDIILRARRKLDYVDIASRLEDSDACDVEITDYH